MKNREPDRFDEWKWSGRIADDKAWRAMMDVATSLSEKEYENIPGIEYSLLPTNKWVFAKALYGRFIAVRTIDKKSFYSVDFDIYNKVFDAEMNELFR